MKKNIKLLMMMLIVAFSLSCASTTDSQKPENVDATTNQKDEQAKVEKEKLIEFHDRIPIIER